MRCRRAQMLMVTAVDGEIRPRRRRALDRHVTGCTVCRGEMATTETVLDALGGLPMEAPLPARLEQDTLRRVRLAAAETKEAPARWWTRLPVPALAVATAAVLAMVIGRTRDVSLAPATVPAARAPRAAAGQVARAPERRAQQAVARTTPKPIASDPPAELPPALAAAPDLFMNLPILRHLEKLEHFEAIQTTTLDEAPAPPGGERSSG